MHIHIIERLSFMQKSSTVGDDTISERPPIILIRTQSFLAQSIIEKVKGNIAC
jgi:hypothetical protein